MPFTLDTAALRRVHDATADAVSDAGEFLLEEANRTAPIEENTLIGSGFVQVDRSRAEAIVAYDTPYAVRQHEDTSLHHDDGRRAKWLEHAMKEQARQIQVHMAEKLGRVLR